MDDNLKSGKGNYDPSVDPEVIRRREMFKKLRSDIKTDEKEEKEAAY